MTRWDPVRYLQFADERSRPFFELTGRIHAKAPARVVDLGCGPGHLTAALAERWPTARVEGVDSSPDMVDAARDHQTERLKFSVADLRQWRPTERLDVIVSNATLQWVPGHRQLLPDLVAALAPGGTLAFQVPGNFSEPSHVILRDLAAASRFADATRTVEQPAAYDASTYFADLSGLGCQTDAWETTYLHVLTGPDPVFRWIAGTGARPVLQALSDGERADFVPEYQRLLRDAYPAREFGTVLPFRRVFVVARSPISTGERP
ncbi:MAG: trans-aconitate 2-methyltransferase [Nocardioidaceae bacterium]